MIRGRVHKHSLCIYMCVCVSIAANNIIYLSKRVSQTEFKYVYNNSLAIFSRLDSGAKKLAGKYNNNSSFAVKFSRREVSPMLPTKRIPLQCIILCSTVLFLSKRNLSRMATTDALFGYTIRPHHF